VGRIRREHDDDRSAVDVGEFVGFGKSVGAEIDAETVPVCISHGCRIADGLRGVARHRFVGVRPAAFALVGADQLAQHVGVDIVALTGEVAGLVVSP
jgi:hypothetical protein